MKSFYLCKNVSILLCMWMCGVICGEFYGVMHNINDKQLKNWESRSFCQHI